MSSKDIMYHLKSGLAGGLISGIGTFTITWLIKSLETLNNSVPKTQPVWIIPLLFIAPLIWSLFDIIDFRNMAGGYIGYIFGYIVSLFILMDAEIISKFSGWLYFIICIVLIGIKIWMSVIKIGKKRY